MTHREQVLRSSVLEHDGKAHVCQVMSHFLNDPAISNMTGSPSSCPTTCEHAICILDWYA